MASGVVHARQSIKGGLFGGVLLSGGLAYSALTSLQDAALIGALFCLGCWLGIILTPDLDMQTRTYAEELPIVGIFVYWLFLPYSKLIPHRNPLSHVPVLGTLGRQIYLFSAYYLFTALYGAYVLEISFSRSGFIDAMQFASKSAIPAIYGVILSGWYWVIFAGLVLSDFLHAMADSKKRNFLNRRLKDDT